jgi:AraC family transcriptional regulator
MSDVSASQLPVFQIAFPSGFEIAEFNYPPNFALPRHEHMEARLILTVNGGFSEECSGRSHSCSGPSTVLFRPAGESHTNRCHSVGARCLSVRFNKNWTAHLQDVALESACHYSPDFTGLITRLYRELRTPDAASGLAVQCGVLDVLMRIMRTRTPRRERLEPRCVRCARELLRAELRAPLDVFELAAQTGVHPAHLSRVFKQWTGTTLGEYHRRLRVEFACHQLGHSRRTLVEIALEAGFYDQAHFSRVFHQHMGIRPREFRSVTCKSAIRVQDEVPRSD